MKKTIALSALLAFAFQAFAYTQDDLDNATYLSQKGIVKTQTTAKNYRLDDKILRQEVIAVALTIKGIKIPDSYKCRKYFSDTVQNDWVCRAIELAADNGIITRSNTKARPQDRITRIEALAILLRANSLYIGEGVGLSEGFDYRDQAEKLAEDWQSDVLETARGLGFITPMVKFISSRCASVPCGKFQYYWRHNDLTTRADIFGLARNIYQYMVPLNSPQNKSVSNQQEIKIENYNVVLYENGKKIKNLTSDGNDTPNNGTCEYPDKINNYSLLGNIFQFTVVKHVSGQCESDEGLVNILVFDGSSMLDLGEKIRAKFNLRFGSNILDNIGIKNNQIQISGEFSYSEDCVDLGCPAYISRDKITSLGIHIIKEPVGSTPGEFEFFFNPSILF